MTVRICLLSPLESANDRVQTGFLEGHQANGAFVACGPPGFTALALLCLGKHANKMYDNHSSGFCITDVATLPDSTTIMTRESLPSVQSGLRAAYS